MGQLIAIVGNEIWIWDIEDAAASNLRKTAITNGAQSVAVSDDYKWLAAAANNEGEVWIFPYGGGTLGTPVKNAITGDPNGVSFATGDSTLLAVQTNANGFQVHSVASNGVMTLEDSDTATDSDTILNSRVRWNSDNTRIVASNDQQASIALFSWDGSSVTKLTD